MDPVTILSLANAGLPFIEQLITKVQELAANGEITPEQQAEVRAKYLSLKAKVEAGPFTEPEWKV
jgi:outer membrane protein TolC